MIPKTGSHPANRPVIRLVTARLKRASDFLRKRIISIPDNGMATTRTIIAMGISWLQRCRTSITSFEGFRELIWAVFSPDRPGKISATRHKKIPPPKLGGGNILPTKASLLANDTGIILRQSKASLMLLF